MDVIRARLNVGFSVALLAIVLSGNPVAAEVVPGLELPGITPAGYPNFENTVAVKYTKNGQNGFKMRGSGLGDCNYLNLSSMDNLKIDWG